MDFSVLCGTSPSLTGISSGEISVFRMASRISSTRSEKSSSPLTQRIRCWISVFGTPALTL